ncbi:hypothetical protein A0H81_07834 [Grifola frondosa]|uniref:Uncharacterized protein n=1 Tax=Grifola frondosa TaxID=5627 RepID=A0A1C7M550_GRIFR|nr:hypothetical protein A0H81_07834 [Grifola frondosa]
MITHMIIDIKRIMDGLVTQRDTFPGGPAAFFAQPGEITFVVKNIFYAAQTLTGDGVLSSVCDSGYLGTNNRPHRRWWKCVPRPCRAVDHRVLRINFGNKPAGFSYVHERTNPTTNLPLAIFLQTVLLAYKIWDADRRASAFRQSSMMPIVRVVMDAGALYSVTLLATLICFTQKSNGQYLLLDMITPIIAITFYMVIIRVGLAAQRQRSEQASSAASNNIHSSRHDGVQSLPMSRLQVHITKLRETDVDADVEAGVELDSRSDVERKASSFSNQV